MKTVTMQTWVPEAINTAEDNELLIKDAVQAVNGAESGTYSITVGADTLIFAEVADDGSVHLFECTIRRASTPAVEDRTPLGSVHARPTAGGLN